MGSVGVELALTWRQAGMAPMQGEQWGSMQKMTGLEALTAGGTSTTHCIFVVVCWSTDSIKRHWCDMQLALASCIVLHIQCANFPDDILSVCSLSRSDTQLTLEQHWFELSA